MPFPSSVLLSIHNLELSANFNIVLSDGIESNVANRVLINLNNRPGSFGVNEPKKSVAVLITVNSVVDGVASTTYTPLTASSKYVIEI